jgi:excisionase family DNA binding protein
MTAVSVASPLHPLPARRLLSIEETAHALNVSNRHLRTLILRGEVRSVRLGRRVLVPREEVDRVATDGTS